MSIKHRFNKVVTAGFIGFVLSISSPAYAVNDAMLNLLKILRDKGSLTAGEYELLVNASKADAEKVEGVTNEMSAKLDKELETVKVATKDADWASKIKLKGDIRTRYQGQWEDGTEDRGRGRIRYRLGVIAKPTDDLEVGAGLASGSSDLRSTNQTFDDTFSTKAINLDYAYAQYKFNDNFKAVAGKLIREPYLYAATDLLWDSDINPEGFSVNFASANDLGTTFANSGIWVLEENSKSSGDPSMFYAQLGQKFGSGDMFGTIAGTYYIFNGINALGDIVTDGTNTDFKFDSFTLSGELGMKNVFGGNTKISLIGDWVKNTDTDTSQDSGYSIGLKAVQGPWSFKYIYADLEENAWPDILPDSDRFDGLTGASGHEFILDYQIMKSVALGLDYYMMENTAGIDQDVIQLDVVVKF